MTHNFHSQRIVCLIIEIGAPYKLSKNSHSYAQKKNNLFSRHRPDRYTFKLNLNLLERRQSNK